MKVPTGRQEAGEQHSTSEAAGVLTPLTTGIKLIVLFASASQGSCPLLLKSLPWISCNCPEQWQSFQFSPLNQHFPPFPSWFFFGGVGTSIPGALSAAPIPAQDMYQQGRQWVEPKS